MERNSELSDANKDSFFPGLSLGKSLTAVPTRTQIRYRFQTGLYLTAAVNTPTQVEVENIDFMQITHLEESLTEVTEAFNAEGATTAEMAILNTVAKQLRKKIEEHKRSLVFKKNKLEEEIRQIETELYECKKKYEIELMKQRELTGKIKDILADTLAVMLVTPLVISAIYWIGAPSILTVIVICLYLIASILFAIKAYRSPLSTR